MINFAKPMIIDGITTKGQAGQPYWIKAFRLLYSMDLFVSDLRQVSGFLLIFRFH
jgi:hypothetical protein